MKKEASANLHHTAIRVRGDTNTDFQLLMTLAATHLRLVMRWVENGWAPAKAKMGRPRKKTLLAYADVYSRAGLSHAPPVVA